MRNDKFIEDAINKMFEICGSTRTYQSVLVENRDGWFMEQRWKMADREQWKAWFVSTIRKRRLAYSKENAERQFEWFDLMYGPVIEDIHN